MSVVFEPGDEAYVHGKRVTIVRRVMRDPDAYRVRYCDNPRGSRSQDRIEGIEQVVMGIMITRDKVRKGKMYRVSSDVNHSGQGQTRFYTGKAVRIEY